MHELQIFENAEFGEVRFVEYEGKPYAVGVDVARMLEYARPSQAVVDNCKGIRKLRIPSMGGQQETNCISEGDIYRLIVKAADQSKNSQIQEKASKIESWVFDEILPTIRKNGSYTVQQNPQVALLKDYIESVGVAANILQVNEVSKITMLKKAFQLKGQPSEFLPNYVEGRVKYSATTLLEKNNVPYKAVAFNKRMEKAGLLEHKERKSTTKGIKKFWSLTEAGTEFGENQVSPNNPRETQPLYYEDMFPKLLNLLGETRE